MLDKLSKNVLGFLLQYLQGRELLLCERISRRVSQGARQDYIWRFLCENQLPFMRKNFADSWKAAFWRNFLIRDRMAPSKFKYEMCPIRFFKPVVKFIDTYHQFVIAADVEGTIGIFLIDEADQENDEDTLQIQSFQTPGLVYFKFFAHWEMLVVVTTEGEVACFELKQTSSKSFEFSNKTTIKLPFQALGKLYACTASDSHLAVCSFPLDKAEFLKDQSLFVVNLQLGTVEKAWKLEVSELEGNAPFAGMINQAFLDRIQQNSHQFQLAAFNGERLYLSLFNGKMATFNNLMSKAEIFLNKGKEYFEVSAADQFAQGPALCLKHLQNMLISYRIQSIQVFNYSTLHHLQTIPLNFGPIDPDRFSSQFQFKDNILWATFLVHKNESHLLKYAVDSKSKQLHEQLKLNFTEANKTTNDIDLNQFVVGRATAEGEVKMVRLEALEESPFFLNCGSKTVKTYKEHPCKPGVSMVKVAQTKIIVVMGNLIRAYSFDLGK